MELTKPLVPAPMPPAPRLVPPVDAPACRADAADAAARRVLHHSGIDAENAGARLRAQYVGIGDVQVVARDGDIEIILQRQSDGVIEREIKLAIVHELIDARRVGQTRGGQMPGLVRPDRVGKMRHRLGIIQHRQGPRFRRILRSGRGGRFLGPAYGQPEASMFRIKPAAVVSRTFEVKRANGIYSSPFVLAQHNLR